jgi:hypothetical protein
MSIARWVLIVTYLAAAVSTFALAHGEVLLILLTGESLLTLAGASHLNRG